jgi:hypothetical protein
MTNGCFQKATLFCQGLYVCVQSWPHLLLIRLLGLLTMINEKDLVILMVRTQSYLLAGLLQTMIDFILIYGRDNKITSDNKSHYPALQSMSSHIIIDAISIWTE